MQRTSLTTMDTSYDESRSSAAERLRRHRRNRSAKKKRAPAAPAAPAVYAPSPTPTPMTFEQATSPPPPTDPSRDLAGQEEYCGHAVDLDDSDLSIFAVGPRVPASANKAHDRWAATRQKYLDERGLETSGGSLRRSSTSSAPGAPEPACYNFLETDSDAGGAGCVVFGGGGAANTDSQRSDTATDGSCVLS